MTEEIVPRPAHLLDANGNPIAEDKIAMHIAITSFMGREATDRCIRAHGIEPSSDRVMAGRQHIEAHGGIVEEGIRWPYPQRPTLGALMRS